MSDPRDESLAGDQPTQHVGHDHGDTFGDTFGDTPFGNPNGSSVAEAPVMKYLSLDEVLSSAKRNRTTAHICLRADLQATYDDLMQEIAGAVDGQGRVLQKFQQDAGLDEVDAAALVQGKVDEAAEVRRQMNASMRRVEFEGMPEDKWRPWYEKHYPKKARTDGEIDLTDFNNKLIAEVAVQPTFTVEEVAGLRSVLGAPQVTELANKAWLACTTGGTDIPKSPAFLRSLQLG